MRWNRNVWEEDFWPIDVKPLDLRLSAQGLTEIMPSGVTYSENIIVGFCFISVQTWGDTKWDRYCMLAQKRGVLVWNKKHLYFTPKKFGDHFHQQLRVDSARKFFGLMNSPLQPWQVLWNPTKIPKLLSSVVWNDLITSVRQVTDRGFCAVTIDWP